MTPPLGLFGGKIFFMVRRKNSERAESFAASTGYHQNSQNLYECYYKVSPVQCNHIRINSSGKVLVALYYKRQ
jgi:hypothetical protein